MNLSATVGGDPPARPTERTDVPRPLVLGHGVQKAETRMRRTQYTQGEASDNQGVRDVQLVTPWPVLLELFRVDATTSGAIALSLPLPVSIT